MLVVDGCAAVRRARQPVAAGASRPVPSSPHSHQQMPCTVSFEKSAANLWLLPCRELNCFPLAAFKVLCLDVTLGVLTVTCLCVGLFVFLFLGTELPGVLCLFPSLGERSFPSLSLQIALQLLVFFQVPYDTDIVTFNSVP